MPCTFDRLPPELWLTIFELASPIPFDPLNVAAELPWDTRNYPPHLMLSFYTTSMERRRAFCLVCRTLYGPALALLLRYVWVHRRGQAQHLARALRLRPRCGSLIRRLDIDAQSYNPDAIQISALDVRDILTCTDGLVSFSDSHSTYTNVGQHDAQYSFAMARIAVQCRDTLRHVHVSYYHERRPWTALVEPLTACLHLHSLEIDLSACDWQAVPAASARLVFRSLRVLELTLSADSAMGQVLSSVAAWHMQRLHTLRLLGAVHGPGMAILLAAHGTRLRHLELGACAPSRSHLAPLTPNLRVLTVTAGRGWDAPHALVPSHPTLERINIRGIDVLVASQHYADVLAQLSSLNRHSFPRLRVVRALSCVSGAPPGTTVGRVNVSTVMQLFWKRWVEASARDGIVIENAFGSPIRPPFGVSPPQFRAHH